MNLSGENLDDDLVLTRLVAVRRMVRDGTARRLRQDAGVSMEELARAVGVSKTCVLKWERGDRAPKGENGIRYFLVLTSLAADLEAQK